MKTGMLLLIASSTILTACQYEPSALVREEMANKTAITSGDTQDHEAEILKWRANRIARLQTDDGWLTLVGLYWLRPGRNSIGSAETALVKLPEKAPSSVGELVMEGGKVRLELPPDSSVTVEGKPVQSIEMKPDTSGEPTIAELGSIRFFVIKRAGEYGVRVRDRESPARTGFDGIDTYPIDRKWRIEARMIPYSPPKTIDIVNIVGQTTPSPSPGALVFEIDGREYSLDPIAEEGDEELFVMFKDDTSGGETYGGGRYLYVDRPGADGKVIVDFNKSYNPPCVFTPFATCPLPPPQNDLPFALTAGEKVWGEH